MQSKISQMTMIDAPIQDLIRRKRKQMHMSMRQVSILTNVKLPTLLQFEAGNRQLRWWQMILVMHVCQITTDEMLQYAQHYNDARVRAEQTLKAQYQGRIERERGRKISPNNPPGAYREIKRLSKRLEIAKKLNADHVNSIRILATRVARKKKIKLSKKKRVKDKQRKEIVRQAKIERARNKMERLKKEHELQVAMVKERDRQKLAEWRESMNKNENSNTNNSK